MASQHGLAAEDIPEFIRRSTDDALPRAGSSLHYWGVRDSEITND